MKLASFCKLNFSASTKVEKESFADNRAKTVEGLQIEDYAVCKSRIMRLSYGVP
jgi:hypothetical protein